MAEQTTTAGRTAEHYLRDLGVLLKEKALRTKQEKETADSDEKDVHLGRLMAFQEIIALMQEQADTFGLPARSLGLDDVDPYEDLP